MRFGGEWNQESTGRKGETGKEDNTGCGGEEGTVGGI